MIKTTFALLATYFVATNSVFAATAPVVSGKGNLGVSVGVDGSIGSTASSGSEFLNNFSMAASKAPTKASFTSTGYGHNETGFSNGLSGTYSTSSHTNTTHFNLPIGMATNGEVLSGANGTTNYSLAATLKADVNLSDVKFSTSTPSSTTSTSTGSKNLTTATGKSTSSPLTTTTTSNTVTSGSLTSVPSYNNTGYSNLTGAKVLGEVSGKNGTFYILGTGDNLQEPINRL